MVLHRHRSGIIYSQAFAEFLAERQRAEGADHVGELLSLDFVRCASGAKAGTSWYQLSWIPAVSVPLTDRLRVGDILVHIHRQTRNGLKRCALDFDQGRVRAIR